MATKTMTLYQALSELKLYDKKIEKLAERRSEMPSLIYYCTKTDTAVNGVQKSKVEETFKSNLKSIVQLLKNRDTIDAAVKLANATTNITINNVTMTIAEALSRKNSYKNRNIINGTIKDIYTNIVNTVESNNRSIKDGAALERFLSSIMGEKGSRNPDDVKTFTQQFVDRHESILIDPNNLNDHIKQEDENVSSFLNEVNYRLTEIDCITSITVVLED
jgi:hypothetical protein